MSILAPVLLLYIISGFVSSARIYEQQHSRNNKECLRRGVCDSYDGYPTKLAKQLIDELMAQDVIFTNDKGITDIATDNVIIYARFGSDEDQTDAGHKPEPLCESEVMFRSPQYAKDVNNKSRFILNDKSQPVQTFRYEVCKSKKCSSKISFLPSYRAECRQSYTLQKMYYIDGANGTSSEYFPVPTCCSCQILNTF